MSVNERRCNRVNRLICIIMAIFVLISGVCFDDVKMESLFECAHTEVLNSVINSVDIDIIDVEAGTSEFLGFQVDTVFKQLSVRLSNNRRYTKISLEFLIQNLFSLKESKAYVNFERDELALNSQDEIITEYIHKTDGKKRI